MKDEETRATKEVKVVTQQMVIPLREDENQSAAKTFIDWSFKVHFFKPDTRTGSNKTLSFVSQSFERRKNCSRQWVILEIH